MDFRVLDALNVALIVDSVYLAELISVLVKGVARLIAVPTRISFSQPGYNICQATIMFQCFTAAVMLLA